MNTTLQRFLIILTTAVMFLSINVYSVVSADGLKGNQYCPYEHWMRDNKIALGALTVNKANVISSHDSMSYTVFMGAKPCMGYRTHQNTPITRNCAMSDTGNARCQNNTLKQQLESGVRYLDLRVALQNSIYCAEHMWIGAPLFPSSAAKAQQGDTPFTEIRDFLATHRNEVVYLNVNALLSDQPESATTGFMTIAQRQKFFETMISFFGSERFVAPPTQSGIFPSFNDIWNTRGRIILINSCESVDPNPCIWDNSTPSQVLVDSEWQDEAQNDPATLYQSLVANVLTKWKTNASYMKKIRVLQMMTSTPMKILAAQNTNRYLCGLIASNTIWPTYQLNIVQVDDSTNSNLMPYIIAMNNYQAQNAH